jgi:exodeoxyribonuclease V alpha subunit
MSKLSELIAAAKAAKAKQETQTTVINTGHEVQPASNTNTNTNTNTNITYNAEQFQFIQAVTEGKNAVLIGAAGTGKTTCMKGALQSILASRFIPTLKETHKHLQIGTYGIVACSFTRRAVANLRKAMPEDLKKNCITIHKLLEYQPVHYEVWDEKTDSYKNTMRFEPARTALNPLESSVKICIIDESSMVSVELFNQLKAALPKDCQFIFLGDIQQLPPVFGSAILGFKMLEYKESTVELTQVYRQALDSPIIRLAHRILSGKAIRPEEFPDWDIPNKLKIRPWKKRISADSALLTLAAFFKQAYDTNIYDPEEDMILIPFNKACGTIELNKHIANHLARTKSLETHEVISGFNKLYFTVGDKVLFEKEDAEIIAISHNGLYQGKWPQNPSIHLDYWGYRTDTENQVGTKSAADMEAEVDQMLANMAAGVETGDKVNQASHVITVRMVDSLEEVSLSSAAEINSLLLSYALTVHKSQGSEWRKVFFAIHQSHNTMIQRELLYTGVTRAREELYVICEPDHFVKGIENQRIKGNTLAEKALYFQGKVTANEMES